MNRFATIDVGTNTLLLLVVEVGESGVLRAVDDRMRIEGLGRGVDRTGRLDPARVAGALDALREYAAAACAAGATRIAAVGTQALREVSNGADFLDPARQILGVEVEVIAGEREAALSWLAATRSFPELAEPVVFDVGGGSTEVIVGGHGVSIPVGAVRMAERHLRSDPPAAEEGRALVDALDAEFAKLTHLPPPGRGTLVGIAGTVTTLAAVHIGLEPYDGERVHGMRLTRVDVEAQLARYLSTTVAERKGIRGLDAKRADVIPAGCAIVARMMARCGAGEIVVSDRGIRWGLAYEMMGSALG